MDINSIADMEIEKFNNIIISFIEANKVFSKENVKINDSVVDAQTKEFLDKIYSEQFQNADGYIQVDLSMGIPRDILMSLNSVIHEFVTICETHDFTTPFSDEERGFISGMKCVDNILKHNKKDFEITDLIYPDFKVESDTLKMNKDGSITIPLEQVDFRLGATWVDIKEKIINAAKYKNQSRNYNKYLMGHDVIDTVIDAHKIINSHIAK